MKQRISTKILSRVESEIRPFKFISGVLLILQGYFLLLINFESPVFLEGPFLGLPFFTVGENLLIQVRIEHLMAFFLSAAGIKTLVQATVYYETYRKQIVNEVSSLRWLGYAVSVPVMTVAVAVLLGMNQITLIAMLLVATAAIIYLGYRAEVALKRNREEAITQFVFAAILQLAVFGVLLHTALTSQGLIPQTGGLIVLGGFVLMFLLFPFIMWAWIQKYKIWREYITVEFTYVIAGFLSKAGLAALIGIALILY